MSTTALRFILALLMLPAATTFAGEVSGTVTVMKKGGKKPLTSFAHAIVYITGIKQEAPVEPAILEQTDKQFVPRLLPVVSGQPVQFWNRDKVMHNVFSTDERQSFDLGRYPKDQYETQVFTEPGQYRVYCNIHQHMVCDVYVLENRYFSVTDKDGRYAIADVPAGAYTVHVWHIYGGGDKRDVTVGDKPLTTDFTVVSEKVVREITKHRDKDGKRYRAKSRYDKYR